jgi:hypothetical protein
VVVAAMGPWDAEMGPQFAETCRRRQLGRPDVGFLFYLFLVDCWILGTPKWDHNSPEPAVVVNSGDQMSASFFISFWLIVGFCVNSHAD